MDKWHNLYLIDQNRCHQGSDIYKVLSTYLGPRDYSISAANWRWIIKFNIKYHHNNCTRIMFRNKADMVLFKLVWSNAITSD